MGDRRALLHAGHERRRVQGGEFNTITVGVNWYLNDVFRIMADYAHLDAKDVGKMDNIGVRFSLFF